MLEISFNHIKSKAMLKIITLSLVFASLSSFAIHKPNTNCSIYGKVSDKSNSEAIPFANVALYKQDSLVAKATTDMTGSYCFKNIAGGKYKLQPGPYNFSDIGVVSKEVIDRRVIDGVLCCSLQHRDIFKIREHKINFIKLIKISFSI